MSGIAAYLPAHESVLRMAVFFAAFVVLAVWEALAPRRTRMVNRFRRWPANIGLLILNVIAVRLLFPLAAVGMALSAQEHDWGLLNRYDVPAWLALVAGWALLDLAVYLQHIMFHAVPALWRLHRVHHSDLDFDVTTGVRFHPAEIILSLIVKFSAIVVIGTPAAAVVLFEVLLNAASIFNHSNVLISPRIDGPLRWLIVTPDMHRVHHSIARDETNSNFGFNLAVWDRLFGTYRAQPRAGHQGMVIGIPGLRDPADCAPLIATLTMPFHGSKPAQHGPVDSTPDSRATARRLVDVKP